MFALNENNMFVYVCIYYVVYIYNIVMGLFLNVFFLLLLRFHYLYLLSHKNVESIYLHWLVHPIRYAYERRPVLSKESTF